MSPISMRPPVGRALFLLSLAIVPGYFFSGMIVDLLGRRGVRGGAVLLAYGVVFLLIHLAVATSLAEAPIVLWFVYVALGGTMAVAFALITRAFARELAGRVNTSLNLACMLFAFVVQAAIGPAVAWMETVQGLARAQAHQVIILVLLAIQARRGHGLPPAERPEVAIPTERARSGGTRKRILHPLAVGMR